MNEIREAIKRDLLRDEHNLLDQQMKDVRRGVEELKAKNNTLQAENDRLRGINHEAEVVRRALKWVLTEGIVVARNSDRHCFLLDHKIGRGATIPQIYERSLFEVVRELELEAEHAG